MFDAPLTDRAAIVTGAARGIGAVIAGRLAAAGADVAVTAREATDLASTVATIEAHGRRVLPITMDLRHEELVTPMVDKAAEHFGKIDILVNNSGVAGPSGLLSTVDDHAWQETFDVNVTGAFRACRAVLPWMISAGSGSIVLIGSITGKRPLLHRAPYAASKMALVGLCRTLALDVARSGIRVNIVSPGFVEGERLDWVVARQAEARGLESEVVREELRELAPMGRFVSPEDIANAVVFLAGDDSRAITGVDLSVAAGIVMD